MRKQFQDLPGKIMGLPRGLLWRILKPLNRAREGLRER